jgi:hypothetical protein
MSPQEDIILKTIVKMKLEDIKGKLQESKFVVQTLDQHIVKLETKFDNELKCIINLNNFKLQVDKDTYLTIKEMLILHIICQLKDKDLVVDVVHNRMNAYHTLLEEETLLFL